MMIKIASLILSLLATPAALAESGVASWYGASRGGCAHKSLPLGTHIRVTNKHNGRSTTCRVNDRGPFIKGRIVDLSAGGARALGMDGIAPVTIQIIR